MNYFKPDLTDIRIGYECELKDPEWRKIIISKHYLPRVFNKIEKDLIQTPYLSKEQIIAEGWKQTFQFNCFETPESEVMYVYFFEKDNYQLEFNKIDYTISIKTLKPDRMKLLKIDCKDINTFRQLIKLLK